MKKSSIVQITLSLAIALAYVYLFGVTGKVESVIDDSDGQVLTLQTTAETQEEPPAESGSDAQESDTAPASKRPALPMQPGLLFMESDDVSGLLTQDEVDGEVTSGTEDLLGTVESEAAVTPSVEETEQEPEYTEPEVTTTEETTTEETTTEETTTEETTTEETTTEEQTTTAPEEENPSGVTFRVYDQVNGVYAEGDGKEILAQVVMGEIGDIFADEAIKAQIVAAYTYIRNYNDYGDVPNVAMRAASSKMKRLVDEVFGEGIYYNGKLIQAVYSASTAGYTASSLNAWGVDYPYLQSIRCELDDLYDPYYGRTKTFSSQYVKEKVEENVGITLSGDPADWFEITQYLDHVYVGKVRVGGQDTYVNSQGKTRTITGRTMREVIMDYEILSSSFKIEYDSSTDKFTFTTYGYGHGVGLSQYGAHHLAKYKGYNYKQILEFYFQGAKVM